MKAAVLRKFGDEITLETVADPDCPPDGVIVEVKACGVCRSDHHTWVGEDADLELPHVMGHEFAGVVEEVGRNCTSFRKGDRVTAPFILGCGHCPDCASGQPTICETQRLIGFTQWGAFAERVAVQVADFNLVKLPESVSYAVAAGMGCRVTTAWRGLTDRAVVRPGEWVAVHGCGGVGLSAVMLASALSARIIAVDISADALTLAKSMGAEFCVNAQQTPDTAEAVREITNGGAHVSIDSIGMAATFESSLRSLRKLGRHVQIGMPVGAHAVVPLPLLNLVYARQLSIYGMRGLGAAGFADLLEMVVSGKLHFDDLITERLPLSGVERVLKTMGQDKLSGIAVVDDFTA
ncbi:MAG: zinc-dependent alcohol dehydrogenase family protein [Pseudomonadota bacterium]